MVLFSVPFVLPVVQASLRHYGIDLSMGFNLMLPLPFEASATQLISVLGLVVLALTQRRS